MYYGVQVNGTNVQLFCEILRRKNPQDLFDESCIAIFINEELAKEYADAIESETEDEEEEQQDT